MPFLTVELEIIVLFSKRATSIQKITCMEKGMFRFKIKVMKFEIRMTQSKHLREKIVH